MSQRMIVESLRRQYLWIDGHFNELFVMITDDHDRNALRAAYMGSRNNLRAARVATFMEDDRAASLLFDALLQNQERIELLAATGETEGLIDLIAIGVGLGSRLADCGAPADR